MKHLRKTKELRGKEMKKRIICLLLGLVLCASIILLIANITILAVPINDSTFPDKCFQSYLKDKIDRNNNNVLSGYERFSVKSISPSTYYYMPTVDCWHEYSDIVSLQGIAYFPNLKRLNCSYSSLKTLDLSKNPHLQSLDCGGNFLETLDLSKNPHLYDLNCGGNSLHELDVSNNTKLDKLVCYNNYLVTLDISNNSRLVLLECDSNSLSTLDFSNNPELTYLRCYGNKLTSLDLSNKENLCQLICNDNSLTELDTTNCTNLEVILCDNNNLSALDVSSSTGLSSLFCNYNKLSDLDVSNNTMIHILQCSNNQLKALDVTHQQGLMILYCADNALNELDLTYNEELNELHCDHNHIQILNISNTKVPRSTIRDYIDNATEIITDSPTHTMYLNGFAYAQVVHGNKAPVPVMVYTENKYFVGWSFVCNNGYAMYDTTKGSTFEGWYSDASLSTPYTFDTPVESDLYLYKKITEKAPQKFWNRFGSTILIFLVGAVCCGMTAFVIIHTLKKESKGTVSTADDNNE